VKNPKPATNHFFVVFLVCLY